MQFDPKTYETIKKVQEAYDKRIKRLSNSKKAMDIVAVLMKKDVNQHFIEGEGPRGSWKGLKMRSGKPLMDTGQLRLSIRGKGFKDKAQAMTRKKYAAIHNYGGTIKPKNKKMLAWQVDKKWYFAKKVTIPKREFMWISEPMKKKIAKFFVDYVIEVK